MSAHRKPGPPFLAALGVAAFGLSLVLAGCAVTGTQPGSAPSTGQALAEGSTGVAPSPTRATPPTTSAPADAAETGCPANSETIPSGADVATIGDVDGDGRADTEFYPESPRFEYGIQTASGATIVLRDDLAGPGRHSGWSVRRENEVVITVLDDSRTATLHALVDCAFVTAPKR
jgi:hypothetical protein